MAARIAKYAAVLTTVNLAVRSMTVTVASMAVSMVARMAVKIQNAKILRSF